MNKNISLVVTILSLMAIGVSIWNTDVPYTPAHHYIDIGDTIGNHQIFYSGIDIVDNYHSYVNTVNISFIPGNNHRSHTPIPLSTIVWCIIIIMNVVQLICVTLSTREITNVSITYAISQVILCIQLMHTVPYHVLFHGGGVIDGVTQCTSNSDCFSKMNDTHHTYTVTFHTSSQITLYILLVTVWMSQFNIYYTSK